MSEALPAVDLGPVVATTPVTAGPSPPAPGGAGNAPVAAGFGAVLQSLRPVVARTDTILAAEVTDLAAATAGEHLPGTDGKLLPPAMQSVVAPLPLPGAVLAAALGTVPADGIAEGAVDPQLNGPGLPSTELPADGDGLRNGQLLPPALAARGEAPRTLQSALLPAPATARHGAALHAGLADAVAELSAAASRDGPEPPALGATQVSMPVDPIRPLAPGFAVDGLAGLGAEPPRTGAVPTLAVEARLHDSGFVDQLNNRLVWMTRNDVQQAQIRINPPHLGPVEVQVSFANGETSVLFSSPHAQVREVLEAAIPRLRESFQEQGMLLADANVADHSQRRNGDRNALSGDDTGFADGSAESAAAAAPEPVPKGGGGSQMVDVYA